MQPAARRHLVGLGNRPVHELSGIPVNHRTSPRWQNVDNGVYRSDQRNTGYRYAGDAFTGARYPKDPLIGGFEEFENGQPAKVYLDIKGTV